MTNYQHCSIIPPGEYSKVKFDSNKCYVCDGSLKLNFCQFNSKLFVIGNLISDSCIFHSLDVNRRTIMKNSTCQEDLYSFFGGNFFNSNIKNLITHGNTYVKNIKAEKILIHGSFRAKGIIEVAKMVLYS